MHRAGLSGLCLDLPVGDVGEPSTSRRRCAPTHSLALSTDSFTPASSSQIVTVVSVPSPPSIRYQAWKPLISRATGGNPLLWSFARRPTSTASLLRYCRIDACIGVLPWSWPGRGGPASGRVSRSAAVNRALDAGLRDHQVDGHDQQDADERADDALHHRLAPVLGGQAADLAGTGRVDLALRPSGRGAGRPG